MMLYMETANPNAYIAPMAKVIATQVAGIVCSSTTGSTTNENYTEDVYEW